MSDGPEWFAPKRYGLGSGLPIAWQGWALLIGYFVIIGACVALFGQRDVVALAIIIPVTILLLFITMKTTRGGWRWRWGEVD